MNHAYTNFKWNTPPFTPKATGTFSWKELVQKNTCGHLFTRLGNEVKGKKSNAAAYHTNGRDMERSGNGQSAAKL